MPPYQPPSAFYQNRFRLGTLCLCVCVGWGGGGGERECGKGVGGGGGGALCPEMLCGVQSGGNGRTPMVCKVTDIHRGRSKLCLPFVVPTSTAGLPASPALVDFFPMERHEHCSTHTTVTAKLPTRYQSEAKKIDLAL